MKTKKSTGLKIPLLIAHARGIWFTPGMELKKIAEYADFRKYLKWIMFYIIIMETLNIIVFYFLPSSPSAAQTNLSPKFQNFQNYSKVFTLIFWPTMFFAGGFITNWLCKKAKAIDKIGTILIDSAILGLATSFPLYMLSIVFGQMNNIVITVAFYGLSFWAYYLNIWNISIIYSITKKLALGVYLLTMIIGTLISFAAMSLLLSVS